MRLSSCSTSVRLGEWNTATDRDCRDPRDPRTCVEPHIDVAIESIIPHEGYSFGYQRPNDIALLRLARDVQFTQNIQPLCLPTMSADDRTRSYAGATFTVAGWGRTENGMTRDILRKVAVPFVPNQSCSAAYHRMREFGMRVTSGQMCAGGEAGKDACQGDSGGPLMFKSAELGKAHYMYAAGIVSFGTTKCGIRGAPGVYTNVSDYVEWILWNMREY